MPGRFDEKSKSKFTRMYMMQDMANLNIRREQLAHQIHYKKNVHEMKRIAKELGRPINILDVGCGEANTLRLFYVGDTSRKADVVASYLGLEGDAKCVEQTRERNETVLRGCNGTIEVCDITQAEWPVEPRSFDLIICNEVLEHVREGSVPSILRNMRRAARKHALFLISTPNKDGTNDKLPADHVYEYGYDELQKLFADAHLKVLDHLGVYIKQAKLRQYLKDHDPDELEWVDAVWDRYGLDIGSIITADLAKPVANNLIWVLQKESK